MGNSQSAPESSLEHAFTDEGLKAPFSGNRPVLVVSIDIGATHSAVVIAFLQPKKVPAIYNISHWPGQEYSQSDNKVPTVLQYKEGAWTSPHKVGAEVTTALRDGGSKLNRIRHFKLFLHAEADRKLDVRKLVPLPEELKPLPDPLKLHQVYSDYMKYLIEHTRERLSEAVGADLWAEHRDNAEIILTHPNLWTPEQRKQLSSAAIDAGLISGERATTHLHMVEEAEAAARYCVTRYGAAFGTLESGTRVMVVDAGGSTVDITTYYVNRDRSKRPILQQIQTACIGAGGIHVDLRFKKYIEDLVQHHNVREELREAFITEAMHNFEIDAKRRFKDSSEGCSVRLAGLIWEDNAMNIEDGKLKLDGNTMERFFKPSIDEIIAAADKQKEDVNYIILTGGLGGSRRLKGAFHKHFDHTGSKVVSPDDAATLKPVALGALILVIGGKLNRKKKGLFRFF